jgi:glutathione S-transferase
MLTVHHLNDSRSQRILWLLEELGTPYDIVHYRRHPQTQFAPPEMKALHQLGKGPLISDRGRVLIESGAIVDYILRHYADGRLQPPENSDDRDLFGQWMHYAEGSATVPLLFIIYSRGHGLAGTTLMDTAIADTTRHLRFIESQLVGRDFLVGDSLTAADVMMTFIGEIAAALVPIDEYRNIVRWINRMHARPAFQRSLERGGPYVYAQNFPKPA